MRKNKICSLSTKQTFYRKNKDNNDDRVNKPYPRKRKKKFAMFAIDVTRLVLITH